MSMIRERFLRNTETTSIEHSLRIAGNAIKEAQSKEPLDPTTTDLIIAVSYLWDAVTKMNKEPTP